MPITNKNLRYFYYGLEECHIPECNGYIGNKCTEFFGRETLLLKLFYFSRTVRSSQLQKYYNGGNFVHESKQVWNLPIPMSLVCLPFLRCALIQFMYRSMQAYQCTNKQLSEPLGLFLFVLVNYQKMNWFIFICFLGSQCIRSA